MDKAPTIEMSATIVRARGKDILIIKKEFYNESIMRHILKEITVKGRYNFVGSIIFTNRFNALITLRQKKLI